MLRVGELQINRSFGIRISEVMEMTRIGSLTECLMAATRARAIPKITAVFADLRFRKILDIDDAQGLVGHVFTGSRHVVSSNKV